MSDPKTTTHFSTLLISALQLTFSLVRSHPLYFSYFIFFSPYLLKLLSFLSPLFITTSLLLLLCLFTLSPVFLRKNSALELPDSKMEFFLSTYHSIMDRLWPSKTEEGREGFDHFEELEAFKMVFDPSNDFYAAENPDEKTEEVCFFDVEEKTVEIDWEEIIQPIKEAKTLEGFFKNLDELEDFVEEKKVEALDTNFGKVEEKKEVEMVGRESKAIGDKIVRDIGTIGEHTPKAHGKLERNADRFDNGGEYTKMFLGSPRLRKLESNLGSYGSMRREVEWKKSLACKLFEERNNVDGDEEGMDSLWEAYDRDSSHKAKAKSDTKKNKNKKKGKAGDRYNDDEEEEEEGIDGKLCCLQALKFSGGKVNLGMGKPNLVKISKAIKGFGWLHHVSSKPGKKGRK